MRDFRGKPSIFIEAARLRFSIVAEPVVVIIPLEGDMSLFDLVKKTENVMTLGIEMTEQVISKRLDLDYLTTQYEKQILD